MVDMGRRIFESVDARSIAIHVGEALRGRNNELRYARNPIRCRAGFTLIHIIH